MIDRIEELLGSLAAEDEEEQESGLALPVTEKRVPTFPRIDEGEAGEGGTDGRNGGRAAEEIIQERPGSISGETAEGAETAGELWKDGPVWTVLGVGPETDGVQGLAAVERTARTEETLQPSRDGGLVWAGSGRAAPGGTMSPALEGAARAGLEQAGLEQAGLTGLYRQTVRGLRPAAPALPQEQAGMMARAQEPGSAAALAVDELDRAVRRDSRRYDGGLSIY